MGAAIRQSSTPRFNHTRLTITRIRTPPPAANHSDLIDEFSSASGPLNGGSAHPGAGSAAAAAGGGPASPGARRAGCFGDNGGASDDYDDTDAVADLEAGLGHGPRAGRAAGSVAAPAGDGGDADGHGHGHHGGNGRLLDPVPEAARLTLVFRDIKGFVPSGFSRPGPLKRAAGRVAHPKEGLRQQECQIMFGLSGEGPRRWVWSPAFSGALPATQSLEHQQT